MLQFITPAEFLLKSMNLCKIFYLRQSLILTGVGILVLLATLPVSSVTKQLYGGNVKISEDLASGLAQTHLFEVREDILYPVDRFEYEITENRLKVDLKDLPADRITEMERAIANIQQTAHTCHWILDYPYFHHNHGNGIAIENDELILTASEPEFLPVLAQSSCFIPERVGFLMPFIRTQFAYEANQNSISGRPFLDSISPVAIDPMNPYLAFKLNEVDAFSIPEEKFRQISSDEQIQVLAGPEYFLFLKSENLTPAEMLSVTSALDLSEVSRAVLNGHTELYPVEPQTSGLPREILKTPIYLKIPDDSPYRLIGERLRIQLQNRGFLISTKALQSSARTIELRVRQVREPDVDLFRYNLLREEFHTNGESTSFEAWDQLQSSGQLVPLMSYESRIAARKNLAGLRRGSDGMPDFSNAWILPAP